MIEYGTIIFGRVYRIVTDIDIGPDLRTNIFWDSCDRIVNLTTNTRIKDPSGHIDSSIEPVEISIYRHQPARNVLDIKSELQRDALL